MFRRLHDAAGERVPFTVDGRAAEALAGDTVAAARPAGPAPITARS